MVCNPPTLTQNFQDFRAFCDGTFSFQILKLYNWAMGTDKKELKKKAVDRFAKVFISAFLRSCLAFTCVLLPAYPMRLRDGSVRHPKWASRTKTQKEILQRETKIQAKQLEQWAGTKGPRWTKEVCCWVCALQGLFCLVTVAWLCNYCSSKPLH